MTEQITILGATGSIGTSTLEVLALHPERYRVYALTANSSWQALLEQCVTYRPAVAVLKDSDSAAQLRSALSARGLHIEVLEGEEGLIEVASAGQVDTVMAAIVGAAGLEPTLSAVHGGKRVLLANKEALVMAGGLFMSAVERSGARLLPIDSEHNAIFQCLPEDYQSLQTAGIRRILLTGSGGPFRTKCLSELDHVTPDEACAHPNWSMGRKISVDSATMMNKGLELIEACWLFHTTADQIEIVVHPQSVIHSMVEYADGSVLAQMGPPDMRTPIAHALSWPQRQESGVSSLNFRDLCDLQFEAPDYERFPALRLAREAAQDKGCLAAIMNAANEIAVEAFLEGRIRFTDIVRVVETVMSASEKIEPQDLSVVKAADAEARIRAQEVLHGLR